MRFQATTRDLVDRRHLGSEIEIEDSVKRVPTESDEAAMLSGTDLDDMASMLSKYFFGLMCSKSNTVNKFYEILTNLTACA